MLIQLDVVGWGESVVLVEVAARRALAAHAYERAKRRAMVLRHDHRLAHPKRARRSHTQRRRAGQASAYVQSGCFDQNRSL